MQSAGRRSELDALSDIVMCMSQLNLSVRAYHRIVKLSPTIADLAGSEELQTTHLAEALQYRPKIMRYKRNHNLAHFQREGQWS